MPVKETLGGHGGRRGHDGGTNDLARSWIDDALP